MFQTCSMLNFTVLANLLPLTVFNLPTKSIVVLLTLTYLASLHPKAPGRSSGICAFLSGIVGQKSHRRAGAGGSVFSIQPAAALEMWKEHLGFITQHGCGGIVWLGIPAASGSATRPGFLPGCSGLAFFPLCCLVSRNKGYSARREGSGKKKGV